MTIRILEDGDYGSPSRIVLLNRYAKTPDGAVRVMRPSDFGNPFHIVKPEGSSHLVVKWRGRRRNGRAPVPEWAGESFGFLHREHAHNCAVALYYRWLLKDEQAALRFKVIEELKGRELACTCPADLSCHTVPLLMLANGIKPVKGKPFKPAIRLAEAIPHASRITRSDRGQGRLFD